MTTPTRFPLLEGGVWFPCPLPDAGALSCPETTQAVFHCGGQAQRIPAEGPLRRLVEAGFALNLRPSGLLPTLPFLPLLRLSGSKVQALKQGDGWATTMDGDLETAVRDARWVMASMAEKAVQDWQTDTPLSEDDVEIEALSILLERRGGALPLPDEHHLLKTDPGGPFLLSGPQTGVRVLTTSWSVEALRLARSALGEAWVPLSGRQTMAVYRSVLPDDLRVEAAGRERWRIQGHGVQAVLKGQGGHWVVGRRRIARQAEQPDRPTVLWAARVSVGRRARRFWRPDQADAPLASARAQGMGVVESVVVRSLIRRGLVCPACRLSFVVGGACLSSACPSRRDADEDYGGAPLVHVRGGLFVYTPARPGWVEEGNGKIGGVAGDDLIQVTPPERVTVRQTDDRTALLIARLMSFTERELPIASPRGETAYRDSEATLRLPSPPPEAVETTRQIVRERAPFPFRFDEALKSLTGP